MKSKKINCLVVDDEPLAASLLQRHIGQFPQLRLIATCQNAIEAFDLLRSESVDLLFLDIQMPGINGIRFARSLQHPPRIIFTTAYRDYAVESYELDVVDYLLKPITIERFLTAINKYIALTEGIESSQPAAGTAEDREQAIFVNTNRRYVKVLLEEVLYIESLKDYVSIHLPGQHILTKYKISEFEQKLPSYFLRVHRSFLVNTRKITAYTMNDVEIGQKEIPIGISYKRAVISFLQDNSSR